MKVVKESALILQKSVQPKIHSSGEKQPDGFISYRDDGKLLAPVLTRQHVKQQLVN